MAIASNTTIHQYFEWYWRPRIGQPIIPGLRTLTVTFRITITTPSPASWQIHIQEGVLETMTLEGDEEVQCEYRLSEEVFHRIITAQLNPKTAFFTGRVKIRGNLATGLTVGALLEEFFRRHPYPG